MVCDEKILKIAAGYKVSAHIKTYRQALILLKNKDARIRDICNFFSDIGQEYTRDQIYYYLKKYPITDQEKTK
ncbi:MAG TPA: hypothetical protein QF753_09185 [Victivallales bacterium]|nr:hypothetical protein [Victivallales bacterium]